MTKQQCINNYLDHFLPTLIQYREEYRGNGSIIIFRCYYWDEGIFAYIDENNGAFDLIYNPLMNHLESVLPNNENEAQYEYLINLLLSKLRRIII